MKITRKYIAVILGFATLLFICLGLYYSLDKSYTIRGKFVGFQYGDYFHAVYETDQGEIIGTWMTGEGCFLALNKDEDLTITLVDEEQYIPEAGRNYTITVATSIRTVNTNKQWIRGLGFRNYEDYDESERDLCEKIQREFIYKETSP